MNQRTMIVAAFVVVVLTFCLDVWGDSRERVRTVRCDVLERNRFFQLDNCGDYQIVIDQWIMWNWSRRHKCYVVRDWALVKTEAMPARHNRRWVMGVRWRDGWPLLIDAGSYTRTYTTFDTEFANRKVVPECERRAIK